tara:strand:+ start:220 stop:900 length:681 start_codon:yes stop_codon:yes gene_type:complete
MINLEKNNINLLIDFDSTFIQLESLEEISKISLRTLSNSNTIIENISSLTNQAMSGDISFAHALESRIKLLKANQNHITQATDLIKNNISKSFVSNANFIKKYSSRFYIISGGFKEIIYPIVKSFGIKENQIYANEFVYNKEDVISINKKNALSKDMGKVQIANQIEGINIMIGDGYTDFEVKKEGAAEYFIQYTETINREKLNSGADCIANNFNQVIDYLCTKFN